MATLSNLTPAIEIPQHVTLDDFVLSFHWGATNEVATDANFPFDDFLAPAATSSHLKEEELLADDPADGLPHGPSSSPPSTRSDIGVFFDWSAAASNNKEQGGALQPHGNGRAPAFSGHQLGLGAASIRSRSPTRSPHNQPSTSKFSSKF